MNQVIQLIMVGDTLHGLTSRGQLVKIKWNAGKGTYDVKLQSNMDLTNLRSDR
jgi:hypothetical protein